MNTDLSSNDHSKLKTYTGLVISTINENKKLRSNIDIPQLIDKERTFAIQNTLNKQDEEIKNLRQENQILLSQYQNQNNNEKIINEQKQFLNNFKSNANTFLEHFNEFHKAFKDQEDAKINQISQIINKCEYQITKLRSFIQNFSNSTDLQSKENQILQLQKDVFDLQTQNQAIHTEFTKANDELKNLLQSAETNNNVNNSLINELKRQIDEKDQTILSLQNQNHEKDSKIQNLQSLVNQDYDESESFNFTAHSSNSPFSGSLSHKTIETLNSKIDELKASLNEKDLYIQKALNDFQNEKNSLLFQIQQKDFQINELKSKSIDNQSISLLKGKIEEITKDNQIKDDEISSLKHQLSISNSNYKEDHFKSLSSQLLSISEENLKLKEDIQYLHNSNQKYLDQIKNLQDSKSLLNNTNLDLNARIDDLEAKLSQAQNQIQNISPNQSTEIQEMQKLHEQDDQKIKSLINQVQETFRHSEKVKNELTLVQKENEQLQNQNLINETNLKSVQFSNSLLEKKLKNQEEISNQKDITIQQLTDSKNELNERYEKLTELHINLKQQFEQSNKKFSIILGCPPDINEIAKQLTSSIEKLADLQSAVAINNESKKEIAYLRQINDDLSNQLQRKEEIIQSTLGKINLCRDGKESEVVKKFNQDFSELNTEYSNLIEEHKKLKNQLFFSDSKYKEIESKLIDQQKINEELLKKEEKIELYEFVTSHFIDLLSSLSSSLISPLIQVSPVHKRRLSAVYDLRVQLKKKNFSSDQIIPTWESFCSAIQESFSFDPFESIKSNVDRLDFIIKTKMNLIGQKINENQQKMDQIVKNSSVLKYQTVRSSRKKPILSVYEKSLKSPLELSGSSYTPREKFSLNTPLTKVNPLARKEPQNSFEPKIETSFL